MSLYRPSPRRPLLAGLLATGSLVLLSTLAGAQPYSVDISEGNGFEAPESEHDCTADPMNPIVNCSFETGDFTGWGTQDMDVPFLPMTVDTGGVDVGFGFFISAPTQGTLAALHGFDGDGATGSVNTIEIYQEVDLPPGTTDMEFDYRGAWDMTFGATQDRTFTVDIEPPGGGAALQSDLILTATANTTTLDTGASSATVDLSGFAGDSVRISFEWLIPEDFVGPGFFQLDNVLVTVVEVDDPVVEIPTLSEISLVLLALLLAGLSLVLLRRRGAAGKL